MVLWIALMVGTLWLSLELIIWGRSYSRGAWSIIRRAGAVFVVTFAFATLHAPFDEIPRVWRPIAWMFIAFLCAVCSIGAALLMNWVAARMH